MALRYRARNWCFTIYDYDSLPRFHPGSFHYMTYGMKVTDGGTHYLQGYIQCKRTIPAPKWLIPRGRWMPLIGTIKSAIRECHDFAEEVHEYGNRPPNAIGRPYFTSRSELRRYLDRNNYYI